MTWAPPAHGCAPRGRGAPAPAPCVGGLRRHRRPRGPEPPGQARSPQRWRRNCSLDASGGPRTPAGIPPSPQSSPCGSLDGSGLQPKESAPAGESRGVHREMPPPPPHSPGDPMTWSPDAHTERHGACGGGGARGAAKPPTPTHSAQDAQNGSRDESQARTPLRMARGP